jgi:hypothetical protein
MGTLSGGPPVTCAYDPAQRQLVAVWPLGTGYHAVVITHVND